MQLRHAQESLETIKVGALKEVKATHLEVLQPMNNYDGKGAETLDITHVVVSNGQSKNKKTLKPSTSRNSQVFQRKITKSFSKICCEDLEVSKLEQGLSQVRLLLSK